MDNNNKNKSNKFTVPSDYFKDLEAKVLLDARKVNQPSQFTIPENYFKELDEKIVRTAMNKKSAGRRFYIRAIGIAASLVIGIALVYPIVVKNKLVEISSTNKQVAVDSIQQDVYQSIYKHYFADDHKKSPTETVDDDFYSDQPLYSYY